MENRQLAITKPIDDDIVRNGLLFSNDSFYKLLIAR